MGDLGSTKDLLVDEDLIELKTSRLAERSEGEDSRDFAIYQTVRTDFDNLFDHLGKGITGGKRDYTIIGYQDPDIYLNRREPPRHVHQNSHLPW